MTGTPHRRHVAQRRLRRLTRLPRFTWVLGNRKAERMLLQRNFYCTCSWCQAARLRRRPQRKYDWKRYIEETNEETS